MLTWFEIDILPLSSFATPLQGTTLFGQWCAELARKDVGALTHLLNGYTTGSPYMVIGDPRPQRHVPRPTVPMRMFASQPGLSSKEAKSRRWMPIDRALELPLSQWLAHCLSDVDLAQSFRAPGSWRKDRTHVRLGAQTGAVEKAQAHWLQETWYDDRVPLTIDVLLDERNLSRKDFIAGLERVGYQGYGASASRGAGRFEVLDCRRVDVRPVVAGMAFMTLGACAPQRLDRDELLNSFYRAKVHFGRHGADGPSRAVPAAFAKAPVVMAQAGALFRAPARFHSLCFGQGIGGGGALSLSHPSAVMQAYAPILPVVLDVAVATRQEDFAEQSCD
jgi:hypothetical protein